jgi:hypothetical protein
MDAEHFDAMLRSLATASRRSIVAAVAATLGHALGETAAEAGRANRGPRRQPQNRAHRQHVGRDLVGAERRKKRKKRSPPPPPVVPPSGDSCATVTCGPVANGNASCQPGTCVITCETGFTLCGSECVDTQTDARHCSRCGNVCPGPTSGPGSPLCSNGTCWLNCESPSPQCGTECTDRRSDPNNCGFCGYRCPAGPCQTATCSAGICGTVANDCPDVTGEGCYKLENYGDYRCWTPGGGSTQESCEIRSSSCGRGGDCYKWATSSCA